MNKYYLEVEAFVNFFALEFLILNVFLIIWISLRIIKQEKKNLKNDEKHIEGKHFDDY